MRMYMILIILLATLVTSNIDADTLTLNNGDEIYGKVLEITENTVRFKHDNGKIKDYSKNDLLKASFLDFLKIKGENTVSDIKDKKLLDLMEMSCSDKYANAGHVTLLDEEHVILRKDGSCTDRVRQCIRILKERSRDLANVSYYYKKGEEKARINYARTILDGEIHYLNEESVQDESVYYLYKSYEKLRKVKFAIPKAALNSVIEYSYTIESDASTTEKPLIGSCFFVGREPKLTSRLVIEVEPGVDFAYEIFNQDQVSFKKGTKGVNTVYTFVLNDHPGYTAEENMPPDSLVFPKVVWGINYGFDKTASKLKEKISSMKAGKSMKAKVTEICKGKSTNDMVNAIYEYVVKEISLHAVPLSHYSYLPKEVNETFSSKFGNYLDKTMVFHEMLETAGIKSQFCYARVRNGGAVSDMIGNIGQYSYSCVYLSDMNQYIFPYFEYYSANEIATQFHGCSILNLSTGKRTVIGEVDAHKHSSQLESKMKLNADGSMQVNEKMTFLGVHAAGIRQLKAKTRNELSRQVEGITNSVHPNARLSDYSFENMAVLGKNPVFNKSYKITDYALRAGNRFLVFRIPGLTYSASSVGKPVRTFPIYNGFNTEDKKYIRINLPAGYKVYYLPESVEMQTGTVKSELVLKDDGNSIRVEDQMKRGWQVPVEDYSEYKEMIQQRARTSQEWIVIEKN